VESKKPHGPEDPLLFGRLPGREEKKMPLEQEILEEKGSKPLSPPHKGKEKKGKMDPFTSAKGQNGAASPFAAPVRGGKKKKRRLSIRSVCIKKDVEE